MEIAIIFFYILTLSMFYIYYGLESHGNTYTQGNQLTMPFLSFWEEVLWNLPGGRSRWIRKKLKKHLYWNIENHSDYKFDMPGRKKEWTDKDLVTPSDFRKCGKDVLPGIFHFLIFAALIGWPIIIPINKLLS